MSTQLEVQLAVEKINKYASSESGDTVEVVERPRGGISIVVADGQRSGRSAKAISNIVVRKAISLLAEGVRDGAVARATHDYLHLQRGGKVSAELFIVSVDLLTKSMVISRNGRAPILLRCGETIRWLDEPSDAVGIYQNTKPAITELPLDTDTTLIVSTDGVWSAGRWTNDAPGIDLHELLVRVDADHKAEPQAIAEAVMAETLRLDNGRPRDDATVLVVKIAPRHQHDAIRHLSMRFPI